MNDSPSRPPVILLMGPTASGKTELACRLSEQYPIDLVSVDSALVYRGMNIGTAKPDAETLRSFPHRLVDIRDVGEAYSVADFRDDALREMQAITAAGRVPLLVGGTGLYFRALERGLSALPRADAALRQQLVSEAAQHGWSHLHEQLGDLDPLAAARIKPGDSQRIQRALEVIALTGRTLSAQHGCARARIPFRVLKLALLPTDRAPLHARIAMRFDDMLEGGFLDELRYLQESAGHLGDAAALRAVGYRQGMAFLAGINTLAEFRDRAIFATRQLAKRQITWIRSELDARTFDPHVSDLSARLASAVGSFLGS
ncbi:MAG: tRNA (adenosine(37)-N6)-dimethylallyltransferase MiaA [Dokdonella sp.]